ncbi:MAG TPA: Ig domain-containing protein [Jatrophihabitans sp.]|nr:Ig domain-containing protein [Jatrophihabitans sp.]
MPKTAVRSRRAGALLGVAGLAALACTGVAGQASAAGAGYPYSPAAGHPYRHGVLPAIGTQQKMNSYAAAHPNVTTVTGPETLSYGGGPDGVVSGHNKTYLIFYGTQWGTSSTDANGNLKFTGDSAGAAGAAQQMFKGIGTNGELWSADLTQWCDGAALRATACPASGASYVPYQTGGVLSGVWYDNSAASPSAATSAQLGQEAVKAAGHFGNTTAAANRYAYYVILSPHGTNPDNYQGQYCAWHDWNGDVGVSSPYGSIAFSNQPYNIDSGAGCGVGFVNSPGTTDGYTITLGHEWHEMMSDWSPTDGWTNHTGSSYNGEENADECAWIPPGQPGGAANVSFGSFGSYAEQASWSNDTNECDISHAIVTHGTGGVTVTNPGNQTGTVGKPVSLQLSASGGSAPYAWSATGLPTGLAINSSTGLISGTPSTAGTFGVTVTARDATGATGSASFSWTIASNTCSSPGQKLLNPGFESGNVSWSASTGVIGQYGSAGEPPHSGTWDAWLDGYGSTRTNTLSQTVTIQSTCTATFSFYLHIDTAETTTTTAYDKLTVKANTLTLATYSNLDHNTGYALHTFTVPAGNTTVTFTGTEDASLQTSFVIDDTALNAS